ncbi:unnamed protein product [Lampetra planeri]
MLIIKLSGPDRGDRLSELVEELTTSGAATAQPAEDEGSQEDLQVDFQDVEARTVTARRMEEERRRRKERDLQGESGGSCQ